MGLKRVYALAEITYPADDPRTLDELKETSKLVIGGETAQGGTIAAWLPISASVDPDAEPSLPETGFAP